MRAVAQRVIEAKSIENRPIESRPIAARPVEALSAHALDILEWEREALIDLVPQLEAGSIVVDMRSDGNLAAVGDSLGAYVARRHPHGLSAFRYVCLARPQDGGHSPALGPLFSPGLGTRTHLVHPGWRATAPAAAIAVRRFLAGKRAACWDGFLGAG